MIPNLTLNPRWKWLFEAPLGRAWRDRLELCLGAVLSTAAVVALASTVRPDPAKVAALRGTPVVASRPLPRNAGVDGVDGVDGPGSPSPARRRELFDAIHAGNVAAMNRAWQRGMSMDGMLSLAARSGRREGVLWVLAHGANIHDDEHSTVAPILVADDAPEIVTLLRERGAADPDLRTAAMAHAPTAVLRSLGAGSATKRELNDALLAAAWSISGSTTNKRIVVVKLLDVGADLNATVGGSSPLGGALSDCNERMATESDANACMPLVQVLLDRGARVTGDALGAALSLDDAWRNVVLDQVFERPLEPGVTSEALARAMHVQPHDLERLVARGVDWVWHDGENDAALPLLAATRRGDRDFVRALLDAGAPVDVHFKDGSSALAVAIDGASSGPESARIVELLVTRGANVNRRLPDGRTPLFAAAESGDVRVVNFLLAHGARVNDVVLYDTALDAATEHGNVPAARIIHAHGGQARSTQRSVY